MNEISNGKVMTIKEVAEIFEAGETTIRRIIEKYYPEKLKNGIKTILNEENVTVIKLELEKNRNLAIRGELPKTNLEKKLLVQQAMRILNEEIEELKQENQKLLPKAEFYDDVTGSNDTFDMRNVAAILNIKDFGRNKIFSLLRKTRIVDDDNIPYRAYQDQEYFRCIESKFTGKYGETRISIKTVVYQKGLDYIRKLIKKEGKYE